MYPWKHTVSMIITYLYLAGNRVIPPVDHVILALDHVIPLEYHVIPFEYHVILALAHVIILEDYQPIYLVEPYQSIDIPLCHQHQLVYQQD